MFHTKFLDAIIDELSGSITKDYISEISRFHRIQASPGFHEAIYYVKQVLDQFPGITTQIDTYPADGKTKTWKWTAPLDWRVADGELRLVRPKEELLARFSETPVCIVAHSQSADVIAPLVYVEEGILPKDYRRLDVKGKIVLTTGPTADVHREAVFNQGALGTIHFPPLERRSRHPQVDHPVRNVGGVCGRLDFRGDGLYGSGPVRTGGRPGGRMHLPHH